MHEQLILYQFKTNILSIHDFIQIILIYILEFALLGVSCSQKKFSSPFMGFICSLIDPLCWMIMWSLFAVSPSSSV